MLIASKYKMSFDEFVGLSEKILKNEFNVHVSDKFVSNCFTALLDFSFCLNDLNECFMEYKKVFCDNGEFLGWEKID